MTETVSEKYKLETIKKTNLALILVNTEKFNEIISKKKSSDKIIPTVIRFLKNDPSISLIYTEIIPDSEVYINEVLIRVMKKKIIDSIIFSGGTGLAGNDITFETLEPRLYKKFNGFGELFRSLSLNEIGSSAVLSRAIAGILHSKKKSKAIFILPLSSNAIILALKHIIIPELGHIQYLINKEF
ncbi:MAG: molybdenum cofactor biosynthesis protein B [Promethearchaeota archaeon]